MNTRPSVLIFVDWYKPGFRGGGPIRSMVNLVEHLGDRFDLWIVTGDTDYSATAPYPGIQPDTWTRLPSGEHVWYASSKGRSRAAWKRLLRERQWNTVYINGMFSYWYSVLPLWLLSGTKQRRIVAPRGMLLSGPMAQGALKKHLFLSFARNMGFYSGVEIHSTAPDETSAVRTLLDRRSTVHEAGNLPRRPAITSPPHRPKQVGEAALVTVVRIATEKNVHLVIEAMAAVRGKLTLDLFGPVFHGEYWEQCKRAIAQLPPQVTVNYHGARPAEEVPGIMAGAYHALCMANEGDNFGHTMLEALAAGLPLLISNTSPWRDLQARHAGWDLPLGQGAAPFTAAMQQLVDMDQAAMDQLTAGAFAIGHAYLNDTAPVEATARMLAGN